VTLGILLGVGILVAAGAGANLRRLADVRLRGSWLIALALALQLLVFAIPWTTKMLAGAATAIHVVSYLLLLLFATANLRQPGFGLATLGLALNATVIVANHGRMPVGLSVWKATGKTGADITRNGHYNNNVLAGTHTHLGFLGDVLPLPAAFPLANAFSVGDLLLLLGATAFVYRRCAPSPNPLLRRVLRQSAR
jgi:membrane protein implicated in regulation of membrane protease activity